MGILSWAKKHPVEAAAIAAGLVLTGGAAGVGPAAGLFAGEAAAGAGAAAGGAAAGGSLIPTGGMAAAGADALPFLGAMGEALPVSELAGSLMPQTAAPMFEALSPEVVAQSFPGNAAVADSGFKMTPKNALMLASMMGSGQQRPQQLGAPQDMGNPMQRPAMVSQEDIMKHWLLRNDPRTYMRLYGQPQQGVV